METESPIPSVSDITLARAAQVVVSNAISGAFNDNPVIGPNLSRAISVLGSVVKRHGLLLQKTTADALAASGRFDVLVDVAIPIVDAAHELLLAGNTAEALAGINIRADASAERIVNIDLVVIDPEVNWAGTYDVKRGNGPVDGRTRRPIEHDLKAARMVLPSYLAKRGYPNITRVTAGIIDYYGATGFNKVMKIGRDDLDDHFDAPIRATLDKVTTCLRDALHAELPHLFATVLESIHRESAKKGAMASRSEPTRDQPLVRDTVTEIINARPTGPGPRKSVVAAWKRGSA
jgi:hypothetical protein